MKMIDKQIKTHMCIEAMEKYLDSLRELNCNELAIKVTLGYLNPEGFNEYQKIEE